MHQIIETNQAPLPIGPYSQAIMAGKLLFISGQIPLCPETGDLAGSDLAAQTGQVLRNLQAVLDEAGCTVSQIVKTTVFMTDLREFSVFNQIYAAWLGTHCPARSTIQVSALPKDAKIEIEAIVVKEN
ncbi:MAG: RidA family protein [Clostridiaceae bacterium]|nr:RidA family protein [Clostridiaceae bacterium]